MIRSLDIRDAHDTSDARTPLYDSEEILHEYQEAISMFDSTYSSLLCVDRIEGGIRHAPCPSLDELDAEGEEIYFCPRRKYAERI